MPGKRPVREDSVSRYGPWYFPLGSNDNKAPPAVRQLLNIDAAIPRRNDFAAARRDSRRGPARLGGGIRQREDDERLIGFVPRSR